MNRSIKFLVLALCLTSFSGTTQAGTIIKLGFSTDSLPDIEMSDGVLRTKDDLFGATSGDQNTEVTFQDELNGVIAIEGDRASFSLSDVQVDTNVTGTGIFAAQSTSGGKFELWGPSNDLLLSGTLGAGQLSGPVGGSATGSLWTAEFGTFTGGTLKPILEGANLVRSSFAISLTDINDGEGMIVDNGVLAAFTADATANIAARTPEPTSLGIAALGLLAVPIALRKRR